MKFELQRGKNVVIDNFCLLTLDDIKILKSQNHGFYVSFYFEDDDFDYHEVSLKVIRDEGSYYSYAKEIVEPQGSWEGSTIGNIYAGVKKDGEGRIYFKTTSGFASPIIEHEIKIIFDEEIKEKK